MKLFLGLFMASAAISSATSMTMSTQMLMGANPIRKVVNMLQMMQKKVEAEGEKAEELYEKFMCYCKTSGGDLAKSIEAAETKIPDLESGIEESSSQKEQLDKDLKEHKTDRVSAKKSMEEATAIREKDNSAFDKESAEDKANLAALKKAIAAISKGVGGSFLQGPSAARLRTFVESKNDMNDADKQDLVAFLSAKEDAPQSGSILGIMKQMEDEMTADLTELTGQEAGAVKDYEAMIAAKKKEVSALSKMIEEKLQRVGELGVQIQTMKNDLEDTQDSLAEDQKFAADLEKNCKTKTAEWEEQKKMRSMELMALADTIKILNDDDALDLFKKTLPSAGASSFMQVQVTTSMMKARALEMLKGLRRHSKHHKPQLDFISLALHGKKIGLDQIVKLIDDLVATLKAEQADDDKMKEYCAKELDLADDKKKGLERKISDLATVIEEANEGIATLADEIAALETGIKALDKAVAEATEQRKKENAEYKELMANNGASKEVILFAKNRLNKFYNPKLYKAPPKTEATAFVQVRSQEQNEDTDAPPPPPETMGAYTTKSEESGGVIQMMNTLVADLDKEMTIAETEEKNAQEDYEATMKDSAEKRAQDSKSITDKEAAKAELKGQLEEAKASKKSAKKELGATLQKIHSLHTECDFLLKYFDVRQQARQEEMDSITDAKAILSGADFGGSA